MKSVPQHFWLTLPGSCLTMLCRPFCAPLLLQRWTRHCQWSWESTLHKPFQENISEYSYSVTNYSRHACTVLQRERGRADVRSHHAGEIQVQRTEMEFGRSFRPSWPNRATEDCKLITLQLSYLQSDSKPQLATTAAVFGTAKGVSFGTSLSGQLQ